MKVRSIDFNADGEPESATFALSLAEALIVAKVFGERNGEQNEKVMPMGAYHGSNVYDGLVDGLFNRFYDDGVDEAMRSYRALNR